MSWFVASVTGKTEDIRFVAVVGAVITAETGY